MSIVADLVSLRHGGLCLPRRTILNYLASAFRYIGEELQLFNTCITTQQNTNKCFRNEYTSWPNEESTKPHWTSCVIKHAISVILMHSS